MKPPAILAKLKKIPALPLRLPKAIAGKVFGSRKKKTTSKAGESSKGSKKEERSKKKTDTKGSSSPSDRPVVSQPTGPVAYQRHQQYQYYPQSYGHHYQNPPFGNPSTRPPIGIVPLSYYGFDTGYQPKAASAATVSSAPCNNNNNQQRRLVAAEADNNLSEASPTGAASVIRSLDGSKYWSSDPEKRRCCCCCRRRRFCCRNPGPTSMCYEILYRPPMYCFPMY